MIVPTSSQIMKSRYSSYGDLWRIYVRDSTILVTAVLVRSEKALSDDCYLLMRRLGVLSYFLATS